MVCLSFYLTQDCINRTNAYSHLKQVSDKYLMKDNDLYPF